MRYLIGRYHEIALKGRNQWRFVDQLKSNLRAVFADFKLGAMRGEGPRLIVELPEEIDEEVAAERAALLFGLQNFSLSRPVARDIEEIKREAITIARAHRSAATFRVRATRADKGFALNSMEIDQAVGAAVKDDAVKNDVGLKVDLENPALVITIEILPDAAYIAAGKRSGAGGLPVGITGHGIALLSGGIDSPVAAHRMMKRGCAVNFVHFHAYPILSRASMEKARQLVQLLTAWQQRSRLYFVAFGDIQQQVVLSVPGPLRVIVYRRLMLRIAQKIAEARGAHGLVTGDVLGQVASQTLENLQVIGSVATLPLFRPLIGMDKEEIMQEARAIATYPISIVPDQDCCTLFTPRNPATRGKVHLVEAAEHMLPIDEFVNGAVGAAAVEDFEFPVIRSRTVAER
jgi:thiamine biosynthesis protein ThiI